MKGIKKLIVKGIGLIMMGWGLLAILFGIWSDIHPQEYYTNIPTTQVGRALGTFLVYFTIIILLIIPGSCLFFHEEIMKRAGKGK